MKRYFKVSFLAVVIGTLWVYIGTFSDIVTGENDHLPQTGMSLPWHFGMCLLQDWLLLLFLR